MANTTGKKFGGRQKGTANKDTQDLHALAERLKVNPFEVLLHFASGDCAALGYQEENHFGNPTISAELRQKAAKDACEYLFPKRKAIEHTGKDGSDLFLDALIRAKNRAKDSE